LLRSAVEWRSPTNLTYADKPMRHPSQVLFAGEKPFPMMPAVDHYAGSEKLINKALQLQNELGPIFDITCDCEDGAQRRRSRACDDGRRADHER
jgi:hypothetical protein